MCSVHTINLICRVERLSELNQGRWLDGETGVEFYSFSVSVPSVWSNTFLRGFDTANRCLADIVRRLSANVRLPNTKYVGLNTGDRLYRIMYGTSFSRRKFGEFPG